MLCVILIGFEIQPLGLVGLLYFQDLFEEEVSNVDCETGEADLGIVVYIDL